MPATAAQARPTAPPGDARRSWALRATAAAAEEESSLFAGAAPAARPTAAPRSTVTPAKAQAAAPRPIPTISPRPQAAGPGVKGRISPLPQGEGSGVRAVASPLPLGEGLGVRASVPTWRLMAYGAGALAAVLVLYVLLNAFFNFVQVKADDVAYGRPRTSHLDAYFDHAGEQAGQPSHVLALNLARRVILVELPGGDTGGATTITGPYLFGENEDLTPITLSAADVNGDGHLDLLVNVKNEQLVYINDKDKNSFHLLTPDERAHLQTGASAGAGGGGQK